MFTALVLVALITTTMTAPVLAWLDRRRPVPDAEAPVGVPVTVNSGAAYDGRPMASLPHDAG
jgi:hypothetical protein